jgi:hypothetical protein
MKIEKGGERTKLWCSLKLIINTIKETSYCAIYKYIKRVHGRIPSKANLIEDQAHKIENQNDQLYGD